MNNSQYLPSTLLSRIAVLNDIDQPRFRRLWTYYRNPLTPIAVDSNDTASARPYRQGQEWGLPARITGLRSGIETVPGQPVDGVSRKEVVIENDIAWRVDTLVDYLFGQEIFINSTAADPARQKHIEAIVQHVLANHGGLQFLQQLATLGAVYGFVDVLVKFDPGQKVTASPTTDGTPPSTADSVSPDGIGSTFTTGPASVDRAGLNSAEETTLADALRLAGMIKLEIVEPTRALPVVSPGDWTKIEAYGQVYELPSAPESTSSQQRGMINRLRDIASMLSRSRSISAINSTGPMKRVVDLITPTTWAKYENDQLVTSGENSLGEIPLVHIQNMPLAHSYTGSSEVEPLIPVQDELNTRLSDRAFRIAMQSFKMYLGRGIDNFEALPVQPGRMWSTENDHADVKEFGGDAGCPSENQHIDDLREAMDKISSVSPIAAGAIKGRIGRLTSAAALRITMLALLARTQRKRLTYGAGIAKICELILTWLDKAGLFATSPQDRGIEIQWPSPIPENQQEQLADAEAKLRIGVDRATVLRELGYTVDLPTAASQPETAANENNSPVDAEQNASI